MRLSKASEARTCSVAAEGCAGVASSSTTPLVALTTAFAAAPTNSKRTPVPGARSVITAVTPSRPVVSVCASVCGRKTKGGMLRKVKAIVAAALSGCSSDTSTLTVYNPGNATDNDNAPSLPMSTETALVSESVVDIVTDSLCETETDTDTDTVTESDTHAA